MFWALETEVAFLLHYHRMRPGSLILNDNQWNDTSSPRSQKSKNAFSAVNIMAMDFGDEEAVILLDFVSGDHFVNIAFNKLSHKRNMTSLCHDNASHHTSVCAPQRRFQKWRDSDVQPFCSLDCCFVSKIISISRSATSDVCQYVHLCVTADRK
jgi:hypothetical protein